MNSGFLVLGIFVVIIGFVVMGLHPYQKGGIHLGKGRTGGGGSGPVWFLILIVGILIAAVGLYLPG